MANELKLERRSLKPERWALLGVWIIVGAVFSVLRPDTFLTAANISNMAGSQAVLLMLALGLLLPLRNGDYDLSVAASLGLSAMVVCVLNVQHGVNIWLACAVGIGLAGAVGLINGLIVVSFDIDPFIVTLGTGTILSGVIFWISSSQTITGVDERLTSVVLSAPMLGIPLDVYYAFAMCALIWFIFDYTPVGLRLMFIGQTREMAYLNGINVARLRCLALVASSTIAGVAGAVFVGTVGGVSPSSGDAFLLPAFAACFLGSTAIRVGRFNPWGTAIAVYFLVTGITGLQLMGAQNYVQQLFYGGALVVAVVLSKLVAGRNMSVRKQRKAPALEAA